MRAGGAVGYAHAGPAAGAARGRGRNSFERCGVVNWWNCTKISRDEESKELEIKKGITGYCLQQYSLYLQLLGFWHFPGSRS